MFCQRNPANSAHTAAIARSGPSLSSARVSRFVVDESSPISYAPVIRHFLSVTSRSAETSGRK